MVLPLELPQSSEVNVRSSGPGILKNTAMYEVFECRLQCMTVEEAAECVTHVNSRWNKNVRTERQFQLERLKQELEVEKEKSKVEQEKEIIKLEEEIENEKTRVRELELEQEKEKTKLEIEANRALSEHGIERGLPEGTTHVWCHSELCLCELPQDHRVREKDIPLFVPEESESLIDHFEKLTPEANRKRFREMTKAPASTFAETTRDLERRFQRWMEAVWVEFHNDLKQLMIMEKFLEMMHPETKFKIQEAGVRNVRDVAESADMITEAYQSDMITEAYQSLRENRWKSDIKEEIVDEDDKVKYDGNGLKPEDDEPRYEDDRGGTDNRCLALDLWNAGRGDGEDNSKLERSEGVKMSNTDSLVKMRENLGHLEDDHVSNE
ncbi:golgin subfamily A member 6-like protein 25 [Procambarus clarkii]|uniref:golgin subfamily A member 6-like protein 25 n=1 Tax=Procambarus clarkii TaxID=6728 RepID=UPI00374291C0